MLRKKEEVVYKNHKLCAYVWQNEGQEIKGTVEIFHGMAENILRYEEFIEKLTNEGYIVVGHDHLAHGESTSLDKIGVIEDGDYMTETLSACKAVRDHFKDLFKKGTSYLFSHSMGSMTAHRYVEVYPDDFDKLILCGTDISGIKYAFGSKVFHHLMKKYGPISYPPILDKLTMKPFNKKFKQDHETLGWLSANKENIKNYEENKYCGASFPVNYYYSIARLIQETGKKQNLEQINKNLKVLLIAGKDDPVTNYSKSTEKLQKRFKKHHIEARAEIYYGARHELLNEKNEIKNLVIEDVLKFLAE